MQTTFSVVIAKTGATHDFVWDTLPDATKDFVADYGLTQKLNDCHSSIKRDAYETDEAFKAAVDERVNKVVAALREGTIRVRAADPEAAKARAMNKVAKEAGLTPDNIADAIAILHASGKWPASPIAAPPVAPAETSPVAAAPTAPVEPKRKGKREHA